MLEKTILKSDLLYNEDKSKRYMLRLEWEKSKPKMCIIMLAVGKSNGIYFDRTTNLVIENADRLGYGTVDILNLFSSIDRNFNEKTDKENISAIDTSAKSAEIVIFAAGTHHKTDKRIAERQKEVLAILKRCDKKLYCIADDEGKKFYHPLCPKVREWNLTKFDVEEFTKKGYEDDKAGN